MATAPGRLPVRYLAHRDLPVDPQILQLLEEICNERTMDFTEKSQKTHCHTGLIRIYSYPVWHVLERTPVPAISTSENDRPKMLSSLFRCPFCRRDLKAECATPVTYITMCFGIRLYRCPHCYWLYWRPCGPLKYLLCWPGPLGTAVRSQEKKHNHRHVRRQTSRTSSDEPASAS